MSAGSPTLRGQAQTTREGPEGRSRHRQRRWRRPHKRTVTATVLDCRGGVLGTEAFDTTEEGLADMEAWALGFGAVSRP